ncbi:uncharacterized protein LOC133825574 [Humulus lupulus]|uniref:uncharacterized protein LOC133825574 n=1 Tax=Humulus lupulus TaxID=3486 RepID=UPI002B41428D|nr:uncharacterized protein LOC133825574 [Humulus lupulus]
MAPHSSSSSSSSEDGSNKEERPVVRSTAEPYPPPSPQPHQPPVPPHQPIGFPPVMGYPQPYSNNYPNNNGNGYHNPYNPYTQPPPPQYFTNQTYYGGSGNNGGSSFLKGFFVTLIIIVLLICVSTIITWVILHPQVPVFHVERLAVSNLNLSKTDFSATWDANLTAENPNQKLKLNFHKIKGFVFFKERSLSFSDVDPMFLETKTRGTLKLRLASNQTNEDVIGDWAVDEMRRERDRGFLTLNVRLAVFATFKSGSWWTRHAFMKVFCDNLDVRFVGSEAKGVWTGGNNSPKCEVF